ncbi:MAG: GTPase [Labilithrix sp.]|nr:GTPase [Labilithrix sp.]
MSDLHERVIAGELRAAARALRLVDDRVAGHQELLKQLFPHTGRAFVIGITGNPGAGKSTLTDRLVEAYRKEGRTVGVICVDPSSPYSGGAILGDRIRMTRHALDAGVFIRSVATRGHLGGLSRSARDMVRVLDAYGSDIVIVETVGVGQDELEITRTAHSTLVVMAPGLGDDIQASKAGILETADVFAVNKADRDGADATVRDLELMLALGRETRLASRGDAAGSEPWTPPIRKVIATKNEGIGELVAALDRHRTWVQDTDAGRARRLSRLAEELRETLRETLIEAATHDLAPAIDAAVASVAAKTTDPYTATADLLKAFRGR